MPQTTQPSKDAVRNWMQQRRAERSPPPTPERVREELGWRLVEAERKVSR
jgi:phosphoribosylaminoimidazole-succinocarboxamide synthase